MASAGPRCALAVSVLLLVGGCSNLGEFDFFGGGKDVPIRQSDVPPVNEAPAQPRAQIIVMPPVKPKPPAPAAAPASAPATLGTPSEIVGQTIIEMRSALGAPTMVRDENPAVVYQYRTANCSLDVVFFMDIERNEFRALSYDIQTEGGAAVTPEKCLANIRAANLQNLGNRS